MTNKQQAVSDAMERLVENGLSGLVADLRAQAATSREAYWLNGAADVIESIEQTKAASHPLEQQQAASGDATLFAWTSAGDYRYYPQFVNVSRKDGRIVVMMRSLEDLSGEHPVAGSLATATLPDDEAVRLGAALTASGVSRMRSALERFIAKYDECSPHIDDAFLQRELHCGPYTGPNYAEELAELRTALQDNDGGMEGG